MVVGTNKQSIEEEGVQWKSEETMKVTEEKEGEVRLVREEG